MIEIQDDGNLRTLTLHRPPVNALDAELLARLHQEVVQATRPENEAGEPIGAVVLAGSPGIFSGGLDVPSLLTLDRPALARVFADFWGLLEALSSSPIPVVAALTGHSPAGGCVLATACDARIMARGPFKIGLSEVRVGLPLPPMIFAALRRLLGAAAAERWAVEGRLGSPEEALAAGLVDEVVDAPEVVSRAQELCRGWLALPPDAFRLTRAMARADIAAIYRQGADDSSDALLDGWFSDEAQGHLKALAQRLGK